jgi:biotin transport system substrate-specific component
MDPETRPSMVHADELSAPGRVRNGALIARRFVGIGLGALLVAIAAQVIVPMVPVPITLQPLAVLVVGGLLGAAGGVSALVLYLFLGAIGLPVYAGGAAGAIHLIGPTGGYLLAFPVAAGVTGAIVSRGPSSALRVLLACALGMAIIHIGGVAQLAFLGGDPSLAFRVGFLPFLTGDLIKVGLAAALILVAGSKVRSLL